MTTTITNNRTPSNTLDLSCQKLSEVSKGEPCRHCGKEDWCYRIGELEVCNRDAEPAKGWVRTQKFDSNNKPYYAPEKPAKAPRAQGREEFVYTDRDGNPLIKVVVVRPGKNKDKDVYQQYWGGSFWVNAKECPEETKREYKQKIAIYRYQEIREAISSNKAIFVVEGEGKADILWSMGIAATTSIGGSGKYRNYGDYFNDLAGADVIVLCPDRDEPGLKHMEDIARDYPNAKWLYAPPSNFYWTNLPKSGGLDIKDWVLQDKATAEDILAAIEDRRVVLDSLPRPLDGGADSQKRETFNLKASIQYLLKEEDPYKQVEFRKDLHKFGYSDRTIDFLLEKTDSANRRSQARSITADEFRTLEPEAAKFIFPGLLPQQGIAILGGEPGVGKTTLAYDAAACVLFGEPFLGEMPTNTGKVLFVNSRGEMLLPQIQDSFINRGLFGSRDYELLLDWDIDQLSALENKLHEMQPTLVVIDSFAGIHVDASFDENSAQSRRSITQLQTLSERYNTAIILIHHTNKSSDASGVGKLRGSSAIAAAATAVWLLSGEKDSPVRNFSVPKIRGASNTAMQLNLDAFNGRFEVINPPADDRTNKALGERILAFLQQEASKRYTAEEILSHIGGNKDSLQKALRRLIHRGLVFKRPCKIDTRRGVYGLLEKGSTPPPPTPPLPVSGIFLESITDNGLGDTGQIPDTPKKYRTDTGHPTNLTPVQQPVRQPESIVNAVLDVDTGQVNRQGGGGGSVRFCTESHEAQNNPEKSLPHNADAQTDEVYHFDAKAIAQIMVETLSEENAREMLRELLLTMKEELRDAVKSHLSAEQYMLIRQLIATPKSKPLEQESKPSEHSDTLNSKTESIVLDSKMTPIEINSFCYCSKLRPEFEGCDLVVSGFDGSDVICNVYKHKTRKLVMENVSVPASNLIASARKYPNFG